MRVYVGTYHKYNCGSIAGAWLDIEDYSDKDEFLKACAELHKDESDPELMFQDHEDIPACYISESSIKDELWDEFVPLRADEKEVVSLYLEHVQELDVGSILERFEGTYDDGADYCTEFIDQCGDLKGLGWLADYIDYGSIWRDWQHDKDSFRVNGKFYVFRNDN